MCSLVLTKGTCPTVCKSARLGWLEKKLIQAMHCPRYTFAELTTGQIFKHFWAVSTPVTHLPGDSESEQDHFESHAAEMFGDGAWEPMEIEN